eukprot:TRINITY_DN67502_c7_g4_i1.p1 TRINITY_DN67502_c7_g4~~TRINITY_DN67502_c7_g4_i1.p1  ORF type:complete len:1669 (-),score=925.38 TRINITY_DN67502_c7_g4_i1:37-4695(-)
MAVVGGEEDVDDNDKADDGHRKRKRKKKRKAVAGKKRKRGDDADGSDGDDDDEDDAGKENGKKKRKKKSKAKKVLSEEEKAKKEAQRQKRLAADRARREALKAKKAQQQKHIDSYFTFSKQRSIDELPDREYPECPVELHEVSDDEEFMDWASWAKQCWRIIAADRRLRNKDKQPRFLPGSSIAAHSAARRGPRNTGGSVDMDESDAATFTATTNKKKELADDCSFAGWDDFQPPKCKDFVHLNLTSPQLSITLNAWDFVTSYRNFINVTRMRHFFAHNALKRAGSITPEGKLDERVSALLLRPFTLESFVNALRHPGESHLLDRVFVALLHVVWMSLAQRPKKTGVHPKSLHITPLTWHAYLRRWLKRRDDMSDCVDLGDDLAADMVTLETGSFYDLSVDRRIVVLHHVVNDVFSSSLMRKFMDHTVAYLDKVRKRTYHLRNDAKQAHKDRVKQLQEERDASVAAPADDGNNDDNGDENDSNADSTNDRAAEMNNKPSEEAVAKYNTALSASVTEMQTELKRIQDEHDQDVAFIELYRPLRTPLLGYDRFRRLYTVLGECFDRVFVQDPKTSEWGFYDTFEEFDELRRYLNPLGRREHDLHVQLNTIAWPWLPSESDSEPHRVAKVELAADDEKTKSKETAKEEDKKTEEEEEEEQKHNDDNNGVAPMQVKKEDENNDGDDEEDEDDANDETAKRRRNLVAMKEAFLKRVHLRKTRLQRERAEREAAQRLKRDEELALRLAQMQSSRSRARTRGTRNQPRESDGDASAADGKDSKEGKGDDGDSTDGDVVAGMVRIVSSSDDDDDHIDERDKWTSVDVDWRTTIGFSPLYQRVFEHNKDYMRSIRLLEMQSVDEEFKHCAVCQESVGQSSQYHCSACHMTFERSEMTPEAFEKHKAESCEMTVENIAARQQRRREAAEARRVKLEARLKKQQEEEAKQQKAQAANGDDGGVVKMDEGDDAEDDNEAGDDDGGKKREEQAKDEEEDEDDDKKPIEEVWQFLENDASASFHAVKALLLDLESAVPIDSSIQYDESKRDAWLAAVKRAYDVEQLRDAMVQVESNIKPEWRHSWFDREAWLRTLQEGELSEAVLADCVLLLDHSLIYSVGEFNRAEKKRLEEEQEMDESSSSESSSSESSESDAPPARSNKRRRVAGGRAKRGGRANSKTTSRAGSRTSSRPGSRNRRATSSAAAAAAAAKKKKKKPQTAAAAAAARSRRRRAGARNRIVEESSEDEDDDEEDDEDGDNGPAEMDEESSEPEQDDHASDDDYNDEDEESEDDYDEDEDEEEDDMDGVCRLCSNERGSGKLLVCDGCERDFHLSCLGLRRSPSGDWFCPDCQERKQAEKASKTAHKDLGSDVEDFCTVCSGELSLPDNPIMYCDGCDVTVHRECYGLAKEPRGGWKCELCSSSPSKQTARSTTARSRAAAAKAKQCVLCPRTDLVMKRCASDNRGKFAHVACAIWMPGVSFQNESRRSGIQGTKNVERARTTLKCMICNKKQGACIQCSYRACPVSFHASCGIVHNMRGRKVHMFLDDSTDTLVAYCPKHADKHDE